jgi:hypothetical protein
MFEHQAWALQLAQQPTEFEISRLLEVLMSDEQRAYLQAKELLKRPLTLPEVELDKKVVVVES